MSPVKDPEISFVDVDNLPSLDQAAIQISRVFRPELILIIAKTHGVCIPGQDTTLAQLAQQLRKIADGLDHSHAAVHGSTLNNLIDASNRKGD